MPIMFLFQEDRNLTTLQTVSAPEVRDSARETIRRNVLFNMIVNITDGGWYGFGLGFASFVTIIPLFVSTLTDSTVLIGLIASAHWIGWQIPQLFTANRVARLPRYKPMALLMTIQERWPFWGLMLVAAAIPLIGRDAALALTLLMVVWQALGAGFTATPWQSMIAKIIPPERRGTFYGFQSAAANLTQSGTAVAAGVVLAAVDYPLNYVLCFFFAGIGMILSFGFLAMTREPEIPVPETAHRTWRDFFNGLLDILRQDGNFRWFIVARTFAQIGAVGTSFYTVYAVREFEMSPQVAGVMTGILMFTQVIASPLLGLLGDRFSHRLMFAFAALLTGLGALMALTAPDLSWFYVIFALSGVTNSMLWTTGMVLTSEFGTDTTRPYYIGLGNTLIAPATLIAPLLGGALADSVGFDGTFILAIFGCVVGAGLLLLMVRDPRRKAPTVPPPLRGSAGD
jgi:MFS family permease